MRGPSPHNCPQPHTCSRNGEMIAERMVLCRPRRAYGSLCMGRKGATLTQTKFKQLLLLLLIWTQGSWLGVAHSKDSIAAPSLMLANELGPNVDPAKYFISEKYDGVRAIWDGKMLRFRSGRTVNAPAWFVAKLPVQALDGELWLARGRFEALSGIVRKA